MRYLFNIVLGSKRIQDPEGAEFADMGAARAEAEQSARDLAAEHLRGGQAIPGNWSIEITDNIGNVQATFPFVAVIVDGNAHFGPKRSANERTSHLIASMQAEYAAFVEKRRRADLLFAETRELAASVRTTFQEMRRQLAALG
jgi:hypothetical protein